MGIPILIPVLATAALAVFILLLWAKKKRAAEKIDTYVCRSCGERHCDCERRL